MIQNYGRPLVGMLCDNDKLTGNLRQLVIWKRESIELLSLVKNVIGHEGLNIVSSQFRHNLAPVMCGMVGHMEQNFLYRIIKSDSPTG